MPKSLNVWKPKDEELLSRHNPQMLKLSSTSRRLVTGYPDSDNQWVNWDDTKESLDAIRDFKQSNPN